MDPRPVLILTGAPGVGKTTTARVLAERSPAAVHLESDLFFDFIRSGFVEPWRTESRDQNTTVMRIVADAAAAYATAGYVTIVDGIVIPGWFLEPLRDSLRGSGHEVAYAVLRAPLDLCVARASARDTQPPADRAVVTKLWRDFAELGPLESHAVDVGGRSAEEAANAVEGRLTAGSLAL
jgi:tRNA uridine 5-carbamoylmethylation protein Kti12